jgi:hypothetical protein
VCGSKAQKSAAVFAVRRANYTHRRKGVFNAGIIEDLTCTGNVRSLTKQSVKYSQKPNKTVKDPIFNGNIPWYLSCPAEAGQLRSRTQERDGHTTTIAAWEKR